MHQAGGRVQPGNAHPPSRTTRAAHWAGVTVRRARPTSSGMPAESVMTPVMSASQPSRRAAAADSGPPDSNPAGATPRWPALASRCLNRGSPTGVGGPRARPAGHRHPGRGGPARPARRPSAGRRCAGLGRCPRWPAAVRPAGPEPRGPPRRTGCRAGRGSECSRRRGRSTEVLAAHGPAARVPRGCPHQAGGSASGPGSPPRPGHTPAPIRPTMSPPPPSAPGSGTSAGRPWCWRRPWRDRPSTRLRPAPSGWTASTTILRRPC
jgi:hypothetical protein